jgi:outer membrane biosynthesis protein TonB
MRADKGRSERVGKKKSSSQTVWIISGVVVLVFLLAGAGFLMLLSSEDPEKKSRVAVVALLKPPPPLKEKALPPLKEKPPEPEIQKKEIVEEVREIAKPDEPPSEKAENKPAGDQLGLDAQGGAGADSFGLVGKKGGRDLLSLGKGEGGAVPGGSEVQEKQTIGGARDAAALIRKFAWYNQLVQEEVKKAVRKRLEENGGIPKGKLEAVLQIIMDDGGAITEYRVVHSSGNPSMDEAVKESLGYTRISEPPPQGIPRSMSVKIISQG